MTKTPHEPPKRLSDLIEPKNVNDMARVWWREDPAFRQIALPEGQARFLPEYQLGSGAFIFIECRLLASELMPCAHCGGDKSLVTVSYRERSGSPTWRIRCLTNNCSAEIEDFDGCFHTVAVRWNRRPSDPDPGVHAA